MLKGSICFVLDPQRHLQVATLLATDSLQLTTLVVISWLLILCPLDISPWERCLADMCRPGHGPIGGMVFLTASWVVSTMLISWRVLHLFQNMVVWIIELLWIVMKYHLITQCLWHLITLLFIVECVCSFPIALTPILDIVPSPESLLINATYPFKTHSDDIKRCNTIWAYGFKTTPHNRTNYENRITITGFL